MLLISKTCRTPFVGYARGAPALRRAAEEPGAPMEYIDYEVRGRVALVTLNRPGQHNAQNAQLLKELDEAFDRGVEDKDVRVIVLKANGKHFSAGHDLAPQG